MPKAVGGRGKKAPYETTHLRIPKPIVEDIRDLVNRYHDEGQISLVNQRTTIDEAIIDARRILDQKKSARISMSKLLTAIYGINVEL